MSTTGPHTRLVQYLGVANTITCGLPCAIASAIRVLCNRGSGGSLESIVLKSLTSLATRFRLRGAGVPAIGVRETGGTLTLNRADSTVPSPGCARISRPQVPGRAKVT